MLEDRRIRKSKSSLKKALINLMNQKQISYISITELCELADVNRSTFYSNYKNINELITDIHNDLFEAMNLFEQNNPESLRVEIITKITKYIENNQDLVKVLFINNENNLLEQNLTLFFSKRYQIEKKQLTEYYTFIYHALGSFSLLKYWVINNFPCSAESLAEIISMQVETKKGI